MTAILIRHREGKYNHDPCLQTTYLQAIYVCTIYIVQTEKPLRVLQSNTQYTTVKVVRLNPDASSQISPDLLNASRDISHYSFLNLNDIEVFGW